MRKIAIILFIVLVAVSAMAREATLTKTPLNVNGVSKAEGDCVVGNTDFDNIQGYYGDWWWGFESYAYLVNPLQEGCACDIEFALSAVHMLLALDTDTNLLVQAALYSAVGEGDCFVPGEELYAGMAHLVTGIPELAYYDIELGLDGQGLCLPGSEPYFIVFRFLDDGATSVGLPVDFTPQSCVNYNDWGSGWSDLVVAGSFVGDVFVWADVDCCIGSVPTRTTNWGAVKGLFR